MRKRDNFTTLGHYGGCGMTYMSKIKKIKGNIKRKLYSFFIF